MMEEPIAVCGIDCSRCPLLRASFGDVEAAEHLVGWWRSEGWMREDEGADDVLAGGPHCLGCRGDRSSHWSPDCWMLKCCVDDKSLDSCHACADFPCDGLRDFGAQNERYGEALNRLHRMRDGAS
jgi:hypothetical protein